MKSIGFVFECALVPCNIIALLLVLSLLLVLESFKLQLLAVDFAFRSLDVPSPAIDDIVVVVLLVVAVTTLQSTVEAFEL